MSDQLIQKLENYKPDQAAIDIIKSTKILLLVGPTGAGKDYLKDILLETGDFHHLVSHTTRSPRINHGVLEKDGQAYFFITTDQAEKMLDNHEFVEAKIYSGNVYGTSVAEIQAAHDEDKVALTDVEVAGVAEYKEFDPNVMSVFLLPPDFETWQERLCRRYGDVVDAADYRLRLKTALHEIEELFTHDYHTVFISDEIHDLADRVKEYIKTGFQPAGEHEEALKIAHKLAEDIESYLENSI